MKAKKFYQWLISEMASIELKNDPRGELARLLKKFSDKLYRCLSLSEQETVEKIKNNIDKELEVIYGSEQPRMVKKALKISRKYLNVQK